MYVDKKMRYAAKCMDTCVIGASLLCLVTLCNYLRCALSFVYVTTVTVHDTVAIPYTFGSFCARIHG